MYGYRSIQMHKQYHQTIQNKIVLNFVCYAQVLQLTSVSVTINPAYGVSCNICTSVTFSATVQKW